MDSTQRFSSRVENYVKHRPGYPEAAIARVVVWCRLEPHGTIADIGSGTGISSEPFLRRGYVVHGVEPNLEMRQASLRILEQYPRFVGVDGTAENTTLGDRSVDLVIAAQAFHWFRRGEARAEFQRILRPTGWVALLWNARRTSSTPFLAAYEKLLREFATDYSRVNHVDIPREEVQRFFQPESYRLELFDNIQRFDFEGPRGRLLSSSYAPEAGHPSHEPMLRELVRIFEAHRDSRGQVAFEYDTEVHVGRLTKEWGQSPTECQKS